MTSSEEELRAHLIKFLESKGLVYNKSYRLGRIEIDLVALGKYDIWDDKSSNENIIYAFEMKLASTSSLIKDVIEQAITRLLMVDYSVIVIPCTANIWVNDKEKKEINIDEEVKKRANGTYSKSLGIICIGNEGEIKVVRKPKRSTIVINELRQKIIKEMSNKTLF
uniref:Uncharacterized protein n=2 Tax=Saccharolobus islandicus TaxID=43080 RepID=Q0ZNM7_SACIS|nr:hypothetical protein [Sulfolobus islandicus]ABE99689.1 hypothetical protein [Sulfolobus islandicus]